MEFDEFAQIEKKRQDFVRRQAKKLVQRRNIINKRIIQELNELQRQSNQLDEDLLNVKKTDQINDSILEKKNEILEMDQNLYNIPDINIPDVNIPDININDSYTEEIPESIKYPKNEMNLNFSDFFLKNYVFTEKYIETEKNLAIDRNQMSKMELYKLKMIINKRIGQVTSDKEHLFQIIEILKEKKSLISFEYIAIKVIEQTKIQVTNSFDSYKPYGFLLSKIYSPELHSIFLMSLIYKKESGNVLKSIYSPYFELLRLNNFLTEAYNFIVSILNSDPEFHIFFVIESYLIILGSTVYQFYRKRFKGILNYIIKEYIVRGNNEPCSIRIKDLIFRLHSEHIF